MSFFQRFGRFGNLRCEEMKHSQTLEVLRLLLRKTKESGGRRNGRGSG